MYQEIKNILKQYNKKDLYLWLIVSAIHPSNQKYIIRYELLIHILISMDKNDFLDQPLSQEIFEELIKDFDEKYSQQFSLMEDWEPFEQTQLIPIFFEKKKYYFFYGASERPYEAIRQFKEILFTEDIVDLHDIKKEFLSSLKIQTQLLELIDEDSEAKIQTTNMYVPSDKMFEKYSDFFKADVINMNYLHKHKSNYEMGINNFNGIYTEIDGGFFILPPQCHIEILYQLTEEFLYSTDRLEVLKYINESFKFRSQRMVGRFFDMQHVLDALIDPISKDDVTKYFDSIVRVDADKILLFKNIEHSLENLSNEINRVANQSIKELENIQKNQYIGLKYQDENIEQMGIVPPSIFKFKIILIFEKLTLNYMLGFEKNWAKDDIFIFNHMDIKPIFELLYEKESDTAISFIKYLEADKKQSIQNKNPMMQIDALDSFSYYYQHESFHIAGQQPDMMMYVPHEWSSFYNEYLYTKYQDNIYELIETKYPNTFNVISHTSEETYEVLDTEFISGGRCIKYGSKLLWIMYPIGVYSTKVEVQTYTFLGQYISFYLDSYKEDFFKLLSLYGFDIEESNFKIRLYPDTLIRRYQQEFDFLKPFISRIESEKIIFTTENHSQNNTLYVSLLYKADTEDLTEVFTFHRKINPEKEIFKDFIFSVLDSLQVEDKEKIAEEFIEQNWHLDERAFTLDAKETNNPRLEQYREPKKLQDSFIANVNQEIVTYLKELNIKSKQYWGEDAKQLNNLIFEFLQNRLESEISKFNNSILNYTYTEIEYIEGKREKDEFQAGLDASKHIVFDVNEKYNQQRIETSLLAVASKHIMHTVLKINPKGVKAIVDSDWYYLMALSSIINDTIQRSDHLHYSLAETGIEISDMYEMMDIEKSMSIDIDSYHQTITNSKISSSKKKVSKEQPVDKEHTPKKNPIFDEKLNEAWKKEYGFFLDDMFVLMANMGRYDFEKDINFPLNIISFDEINNFVQKYIVEPPTTEEVQHMLDFLSLDFTTFENFKYIDYSIDRLMQKRERLNLSPFIKVDDSYLFGNQLLLQSSLAWYYPLIGGDIPFKIDDNSSIKQEIKKIHRELDLELENEAYEITKETLGEDLVEKNILNFKRLSRSFPKQPPCGEIDLLAINKKTKTLFVMDAKNVNRKLFTSAIKRELRDFFYGRGSKKSYLAKLNLKVDFISENLDEILKHFNIDNKNEWKIKKGFVVNTLYFSAFYDEKVDFVLLDDLSAYLTKETD